MGLRYLYTYTEFWMNTLVNRYGYNMHLWWGGEHGIKGYFEKQRKWFQMFFPPN